MTTRGDANLIQKRSSSDDLTWHNPRNTPFTISGLPWLKQNNDYGRLPQELRPCLRESLAWVSMQPSGVMVRLRTNSKRIAVRAHIDRNEFFAASMLPQTHGFDVYIGSGKQRRFAFNLCPSKPLKRYTSAHALPDGTQEVSIYFPLLNPVKSLKIGLEPGCLLTAAPAHARKAIFFYGSSITQGFSASRPGLTYPARVCRDLDAQLINLGFGGNAKGDLEVAEAIGSVTKSIPTAAIVYDYDHNTDNIPHLNKTHQPFFRQLRQDNPDTPIIVMSSIKYWADTDFFGQRAKIIETTVRNAQARGDKNVHFLAGYEMWPKEYNWQDLTSDCLHPNDHGFAIMAQAVQQKLRSLGI